ncbi:MAG: FadR family transcriptional regulator [Ignavibacteriales bacterium]|nr:FadR family transcriptional regulator [Ignavibacteriales bacterium]
MIDKKNLFVHIKKDKGMNGENIFTLLETREPIGKLIIQQIEQAILENKYIAGSKLPSENELCEQFGVSRTSVREALGTLEAQGIIEIVKGKGMFVKKISTETVTNLMRKYLILRADRNFVMDLVHARQIIEPAISYYAALNFNEEDIERLTGDIENLKKCSGDYVELANLDTMFHLDLARASRNRIMPLLLHPIHELIPEVKSTIYATVDDAKGSAVIWHQKILDAVISRDAEKARTAMEEHLKIAEEHAEKMLEAQKQKIVSDI